MSLDDATNYLSYQNALRLIFQKDRGNFILLSETVYKIAILTEQLFRRAINSNRGLLPIEPQFGAMLCSKVLEELLSNVRTICDIFPELNSHIFDKATEELSSHVYTLAKIFIVQYIEMRMFTYSKICTLRQTGLNLRHHTNRQLVWMHQ